MRAAAESQLSLDQLFARHVQRREHLLGAKVDQQRALIEDRVAIEESTGAADLAAVDFDVVARPILGIDAKPVQPRGRSFTHCLGEFRQRCDAERPAMKDELKSQLSFIHEQRASAGDAADGLNPVGGAIVEVKLARECLMAPDERRRPKLQETYRVRDCFFTMQIDQRLIEGDIQPPVQHAGIDDTKLTAHDQEPSRGIPS